MSLPGFLRFDGRDKRGLAGWRSWPPYVAALTYPARSVF